MISKNKTLLLLLFSLFLGKTLLANDSIACNLWVDSVFSTLTPDERIGQLFVYNTPAQNDSKTINTLLREIKEQHIGGLLFWDGNIAPQAELTNLAQASSKVPLMITLDGEWGLSMRLKDGLRYPKKMTLGALTDENLIYGFGAEMGRECNELRINVNFDPVLDVNLNPQNPVINTRSFGENPQDIARKATLFVTGLQSKKVWAVGKHFPGHGDTSQDSHQELAIVTHNCKQLNEVDLVPFKELIDRGLSGIMVGHISVPSIDSSGTPASLSPLIIKGLLKNQLHFEGLVFTDALKMKGVSNQPNLSVRALLAGNDVLLDPMSVEKEFEAIKKAIQDSVISMDLIDQKCKKILKYKYLCGLNHYNPIKLEGLEARINSPEAILLQQKMAQQSITVLKNKGHIIPIKELKNKQIAIVSVGASNQTQFIETASLYDKIYNYTISASDSSAYIHNLACELDTASLIIFAIHNTQVSDSVIACLGGNKKTILAFFTSPYQLKNYPLSIHKSEACILGYENLKMMQDACAQTLFGGIPSTGKVPVTVPDLVVRGEGIDTKKICLGYGVPESEGLNSTVLQRIDSIAQDAIAKGATPGCQILVAKKGTVIYRKSFGFHDYSNLIPVKNTDVYDLASVTKISATLPIVMKLYDEKKINLNEKISSYLPDLKHTNKEDITVYELLTHQAGLVPFIAFYQQAIDLKSVGGKLMQSQKDSNYTVQVDQNFYGNKKFTYKPNLVSSTRDSIHSLQIADSLFILESFRDSVWEQIKKSPVSKDKKYVYSDLSFLILQRIIERITKKPLDKLVTEYYYKELGADKIGFNPLKRIQKIDVVPTECDSFLRKQLLQGYVHDQNAAFMGDVAGHAGNFSNCNDLAKIYQMILNGGTYGGKDYLSPETCTFFTTNKSDISRRGLGFDRSETQDINKRSMFGHTGFTGTCVWVDPKEEIIYIFLSNRVNPESWNKKLIQMNVRSNIEQVIYQSIIK